MNRPIVVGINSLSSSKYTAYTNHIQIFYQLGLWAKGQDRKVALVNPDRMSIDRMRNLAAKTAIEIDAEYLLFIDDDVVIPTRMPEPFIKYLIDSDSDIVAGDVLIRGYPFNHMSFIGDSHGLNPIEDLAKEVENQETPILNVGAVGFSLCLIRVDLLKKIPDPWFITGPRNTEDIYFCLKAREFVPDCTIRLDSRVTCGHILWDQIIDRGNKEDYMVYMESQEPKLLGGREKPEVDRGDSYLKKILNKVDGPDQSNLELVIMEEETRG